MTTERHLNLMSLMNDIEAPTKIYRSALRKAWNTQTDSSENTAAKAKGNTALEEIETVVRDWVAKHPVCDADRLAAAAHRALTAFEDLIAESRDPGVEALGARYELATALQRVSPYEKPLDEPGFDPRADLARIERELLAALDSSRNAYPELADAPERLGLLAALRIVQGDRFGAPKTAAALQRADEIAAARTPCSISQECDTDGNGEPCDRHEREQAHAEGEHAFCGDECTAAVSA